MHSVTPSSRWSASALPVAARRSARVSVRAACGRWMQCARQQRIIAVLHSQCETGAGVCERAVRAISATSRTALLLSAQPWLIESCDGGCRIRCTPCLGTGDSPHRLCDFAARSAKSLPSLLQKLHEADVPNSETTRLAAELTAVHLARAAAAAAAAVAAVAAAAPAAARNAPSRTSTRKPTCCENEQIPWSAPTTTTMTRTRWLPRCEGAAREGEGAAGAAGDRETASPPAPTLGAAAVGGAPPASAAVARRRFGRAARAGPA